MDIYLFECKEHTARGTCLTKWSLSNQAIPNHIHELFYLFYYFHSELI